METKEMFNTLIDVHNKLLDISVKGEDVIRMADILRELRATIVQIQQSKTYNSLNDSNLKENQS